jgi:acid phosphatase family membrane protein YuiD
MTLVLNDAEQLRRRHGGTLEVLNQMSDKKTFIPDDVVAEIQEKARRDIEFRKMLVANPQEALGEFGIVIPGSSPDDKNYLETVHAMYDRAEFSIVLL